MLLGNPWKDLDLRVIHPGTKEERNSLVEEICSKHGKIILKLSFSDDECFVLRTRFPGKKQIVTDIQVVSSFESTPGDFTISSLLMDLATGKIHQQQATGFDDLQNKLIRPVAGDRVFEVEAPYITLRALKLACQTGFDLEANFERNIRSNTEKVTEHINEEIAYIKEHGKDSWAETRLGNIFNGLKTDPKRYTTLINDLGLYPALCRGFGSVLAHPKSVRESDTFDTTAFTAELPFEKRISLFLSQIIRSISNHPEKSFAIIKKALALDASRADGNEFVIDPERIVYIP